ncbi:glycosyltransferase family A protein [Morganella morganii]|uniref:glycosyltransferase family A protein n=1 Tax=Morganella morganii TaxID=582 RepID=UPI003B9EDA5E|nr:glycosyltransferase family 2 protein [Morganella morganii]
MKIEVLISTLNDGIFNIKFNSKFRYLIIHQISNNKDYHEYTNTFANNIVYIPSSTLGLSISRNIALSHASGDFLWIMDDDVTILENSLENLLANIERYPDIDMFVLNHTSNPEIKNDNIKYKNDFLLNKLSSMSVSSIDILLKRTTIGDIKFNESFGLGSSYPSGEEYIFCNEYLNSKKKILRLKNYYSYHPDISSGSDFYSSPRKIETKLRMFILCFGKCIGYMLFIAFIIKKTNIITKNKSWKHVLHCLNQMKK